jgi:tetracycline resistance efflux pump
LAAGCDHLEHVRTQLPYALTAAAVTVLLYLLVAWSL